MASYRTSGGPAGIITSAPRTPGVRAGGLDSVIASAPRAAPLTTSLGNTTHYGHTKASDLRGGYTSALHYSRREETGLSSYAYNRESTLTSGYTNSGLYAHVRPGRSSSKPATTVARRTPAMPATPAPSTHIERADTRRSALYSLYTNTTPDDTWDRTSTANYTRTSTPGRSRPLSSHASNSYYGHASLSRPMRSERVTLVLDLDETLVHSSFEPTSADLHIPLVMDGEQYTAYVKKRPFVDQFLAKCVELFDVVIWTASLSIYAEPLIQELSRHARCGPLKQMYREHCTQIPTGGYVKDLTIMGRSLNDVCIVDNSPAVAQYQPKNLIPIVSWYDCPNDTALRDMIPFLEKLAKCQTVYDTIPTLSSYVSGY
eukprot:TRINITY_DN176_c0_g2_i1.p1 TRINITY_DN176_c0_g2~~TRINITY_DN176_c0_g2_i1.p1  ORF type:complete len:373 (+),score=108.82 TRINITY_DN176_c0_g2_i1:65-1183(+)